MPLEIITCFHCTNADCAQNGVHKGAVSRPPEGVTPVCGTCGSELTEDASHADEWRAANEVT